MKPQFFRYLRLAQAICGPAVLLLEIWLWWEMSLWVPEDQRKFDSDAAWFAVWMAGPGLCLVVAGLLQAIYRWVWPSVLTLLAGAVAAYVWLVVWWLFIYSGRRSSLPIVYVYLIVLLLTVAASLGNAIVELVLRFSKQGAEQIVGRERRGVFRIIIGPAMRERSRRRVNSTVMPLTIVF